jgi:uncharacterized membrane protein YhhN
VALTLILLTLVVAVVDWVAVGRQGAGAQPDDATPQTVERVAKPLTLATLIAAAVATAADHHPSAVVFGATLVALAFSLLGDVFLLGPDRRIAGQPNFVLGLGAFLVAHLSYLVAFVKLHGHGSAAISAVLTGLVLAGAVFAAVGRPILAGARAEDPRLAGPVLAYLVVISLMVVGAWWTLDLRVILGASLFAFSDAVIGWTRFRRPDRRGPVTVIVTYHLAQILLVLGLLRR